MLHMDERGLFKIGGVAALTIAVMYLIAMAVYIPAYRAGPPPGSINEWFSLFERDRLTGLFSLGLADIVIMLLWVPLAVALYTALKQIGRMWLTILMPLVFIGIAVYLATNIAFSMLTLSIQYEAAASETQKSLILGAGQALIAISQGTGAYFGMPLVWFASLIISMVMLKSSSFDPVVAIVGMVGFGLLLVGVPFASYTTTGTMTTAVTAIVAVSYIGGGLLSLIWYVLVGLRFFGLCVHEDQVLA
jgi:hypothetical protein